VFNCKLFAELPCQRSKYRKLCLYIRTLVWTAVIHFNVRRPDCVQVRAIIFPSQGFSFSNYASLNSDYFGWLVPAACIILSCIWSDYRRGLNCYMDLLTILTHDFEMLAITAPPLISTVHEPPQHSLSLFQPAVFSPDIFWQRLLIQQILQLHTLKSSLPRLRYRTELSSD
jgi:hypothetical protein